MTFDDHTPAHYKAFRVYAGGGSSGISVSKEHVIIGENDGGDDGDHPCKMTFEEWRELCAKINQHIQERIQEG